MLTSVKYLAAMGVCLAQLTLTPVFAEGDPQTEEQESQDESKKMPGGNDVDDEVSNGDQGGMTRVDDLVDAMENASELIQVISLR